MCSYCRQCSNVQILRRYRSYNVVSEDWTPSSSAGRRATPVTETKNLSQKEMHIAVSTEDVTLTSPQARENVRRINTE